MIKNKKVTYFLGFFLLFFMLRFAYKYSPRRIEFLGHYDKVWAHRVDSKEKLNAAVNSFQGLELDLVYLSNSKTLDVGHPPTPSIGLSFKNYLAAIPDEKQPFLWLDIKNLKPENVIEINHRITALIKAKNYPFEKILIESENAEALPLLDGLKFQALYYLPVELHTKTSDELEKEIGSIQGVLSKNPQLGISSNYKNYEIVAKHFPKQKKYLWKIDGLTFNNYSKTRKILKDTTVKVVLSRYKSFKGNR